MFKIVFLIFLFSVTAFAQTPQMISIKDYNPQVKYKLPICIVDSSGEMECKYPPKKEEEKKTEQTQAKPKNKYILPGEHIGQEMGADMTTLGSHKGVGFNYFYRDHHMSFGGKLAGYMYSPPIGEESSDSMDFLAQAQLNYHIFPRWYSKMPNKYSFDPSLGLSLGYLHLGEETKQRSSTPFVGFSLRVARPLTDSLGLYIEIESLQSFSNENKANLGSLGLSFDF